MGLFDSLKDAVGKLQGAENAGKDFNPTLDALEKKLEELHAAGKVNDAVYNAEQLYKKEHAEYEARKDEPGADHQTDVKALLKFLGALENAEGLDPELKALVDKAASLKNSMMGILGKLAK